MSFEESPFPDYVLDEVRKAGFKGPTPIQSQGWPMALSGRDLVGIAQTGSGKTLSFLLPAIVHINAQPYLKPGDGPIVLVLAPTRELAVQIQEECNKFGSTSSIKHTCTCMLLYPLLHVLFSALLHMFSGPPCKSDPRMSCVAVCVLAVVTTRARRGANMLPASLAHSWPQACTVACRRAHRLVTCSVAARSSLARQAA